MLDFGINRMQFFKVFDGSFIFARFQFFVAGISTLLVMDVSVKAIAVHRD